MVIKNGKFVAQHVDPMDESSIQPHGYDLHIGELHLIKGNDEGNNRLSESLRNATTKIKLRPDAQPPDYFNLCYKLVKTRSYLVVFREKVTIPKDCVGFTTQRSSLMRNGITMNVGVWDAGYNGKGTSLLTPSVNLYLSHDMGVAQLLFMEAEKTDSPYSGNYQREGVK